MRPRQRRGVPARAAAALAVLLAAGLSALVLEASPAGAAPHQAAHQQPHQHRPTPKPSSKVPPGHASPTPSPTPSPSARVTAPATAVPSSTTRSTPSAAATSAAPAATARAVAHHTTPVAVVTARPTATRRAATPQPTATHQRWREDETFGAAAHSIAKVATTSPQLPLGVLGAVLLFLAVQNRIDRRDPKLAVSDASSSLEMEFHAVRRRTPEPPRRRTVPLTIRTAPGAITATDIAVPDTARPTAR